MKSSLPVAFVALAVALPVTFSRSAGDAAGTAPAQAAGVISGVVTGPSGPEAGVWVIAETSELPTKYAKIVVTDDRGRYVLPELPRASYSVWVRGYGLIDSPKRTASPGQVVNLTAVPAPSPAAAAEYYPAGYWYSLMKIPGKEEFPGTGPEGNGLGTGLAHQAQLLARVKSTGCTACHQLGTKGTREFPPSLGKHASSVAAWERRLQSGQAGGQML
ncbi:MAG: carboxypeptidase regulatory-like domain-containing protein, partial [Cytophagaceae bacterium]|nr:carboxypeptidase regulatory-like domain-containing protein [Gemmatimonadaceae bacterium]